jgi:hypothetical protein
MFMLPSFGRAEPTVLTSERALKLKMYNDNSGDAELSIKAGLQMGKGNNLSMVLGYGQTIGRPFVSTGTAMGVFGSGLLYSNLAALSTRLGPAYVPLVTNSWGKNGLNFAADGKVGSFLFGGTYLGSIDTYALNFGGTLGRNFTGKGLYISGGPNKNLSMIDATLKW